MNWYSLLALTTYLTAVLANIYAVANSKNNTARLVTRQDMMVPNSMLYNMHAKGLLINNNQQTFCQATIISDTAAVLAASCFDYNDSGKADSTKYKVYVEATDPSIVSQAQVSSITPHPSYNPQTFANNIAVVTFSAISTGMEYIIDNKPGLWETFLHISNSLNSANTQWNTPEMSDLALGDQNACEAASSLFKANKYDFFCTVGTIPSMFHSGCMAPYKFLLGHNETGTGMLGFYSHSAILGGNPFCDHSEIYNYYLRIDHYIPWINTVVDPDVYAANRDNVAPDATTPDYAMATPGTQSTDGRKIYSLNNQEDILPLIKAVPSTPEESGVLLEPAVPAESELTTVSVTETETETITQTLDPVTVTVTATGTLTNTEQTTDTLSTTQQQTDTVDHTTTVSETVTATETTTEMVTTTLIQSFTGTLTNTMTDMQTQSQTLTTSFITTVVSASECPVMTCNPSIEVSEVTVTETQIESSVEVETVTVTELGEITNEETEISTMYITVIETQSADTVTETTTVIQSESAEPEIIVSTVTATDTSTEKIIETETEVETTTETENVMDSPEEPSEEPEDSSSTAKDKPSSLKPWMIALIIIIVLAVLLIMLLLGCLYYRWRKRQHDQYLTGMVRPASYPPDYFNPELKEKGYDPYYIPSRYAQSERQSRYNSNGSYVGYI
ncbi:hypothetical protein LPJ55_002949 [Coemansia sp. RSA 990]|nr:hypothetical protein LPJ55_002949 [Coemansia sp. RSA 990]